MFGENLTSRESNKIYLIIFNRYKNLLEIKELDKGILNDNCLFQALSKIRGNKIGLKDIMNIEIARHAEMQIITSERNITTWKLIY